MYLFLESARFTTIVSVILLSSIDPVPDLAASELVIGARIGQGAGEHF